MRSGLRWPSSERHQHGARAAGVGEVPGHLLIGARQWIPRERIEDPVTSLVMGLPLGLEFRTKGAAGHGHLRGLSGELSAATPTCPLDSDGSRKLTLYHKPRLDAHMSAGLASQFVIHEPKARRDWRTEDCRT